MREKINNADVEAARYNIPHLISSLQEASTSSEKVQELVPRVLVWRHLMGTGTPAETAVSAVSVSPENLACLHSGHSQTTAVCLECSSCEGAAVLNISNVMPLYHCILYLGHRLQVVHPRYTVTFFLMKRTQIFVEGGYMSTYKNYISQASLEIAGANDTIWPMRCEQKLLDCGESSLKRGSLTRARPVFPSGFLRLLAGNRNHHLGT